MNFTQDELIILSKLLIKQVISADIEINNLQNQLNKEKINAENIQNKEENNLSE